MSNYLATLKITPTANIGAKPKLGRRTLMFSLTKSSAQPRKGFKPFRRSVLDSAFGKYWLEVKARPPHFDVQSNQEQRATSARFSTLVEVR
jgi:hypothetical protein